MAELEDWAEREVALFKEKNPELFKEKYPEFDFGTACLFLDSLINRTPLTPIENTEDVWVKSYDRPDSSVYQCKRMPSLFKEVYNDGTVKYNDTKRVICVDDNNEFNNQFYDNLVSSIINELEPIEFPYYPSIKPIIVYLEDICLNDDESVRAIKYAILHGKRIDINRYFVYEDCKYEEVDSFMYVKERERILNELAKGVQN